MRGIVWASPQWLIELSDVKSKSLQKIPFNKMEIRREPQLHWLPHFPIRKQISREYIPPEWHTYYVHIRTAKKNQLTSNFCFLDCDDVRLTLRHWLHPTGPRCLDLWSPSRLRRRSTVGIHVEAPDSIDVPANDTHDSSRFSKFRTSCHCILRIFPA